MPTNKYLQFLSNWECNCAPGSQECFLSAFLCLHPNIYFNFTYFFFLRLDHNSKSFCFISRKWETWQHRTQWALELSIWLQFHSLPSCCGRTSSSHCNDFEILIPLQLSHSITEWSWLEGCYFVDYGGHLAQPPAPTGSPRAGCPWLCPDSFWISQRKLQKLWATCTNALLPSEQKHVYWCSGGASCISVHADALIVSLGTIG